MPGVDIGILLLLSQAFLISRSRPMGKSCANHLSSCSGLKKDAEQQA